MNIKPGDLVWYKKSLMSDRMIGLVIDLTKYDLDFGDVAKFQILSAQGNLQFILDDLGLDDLGLKVKVIK